MKFKKQLEAEFKKQLDDIIETFTLWESSSQLEKYTPNVVRSVPRLIAALEKQKLALKECVKQRDALAATLFEYTDSFVYENNVADKKGCKDLLDAEILSVLRDVNDEIHSPEF